MIRDLSANCFKKALRTEGNRFFHFVVALFLSFVLLDAESWDFLEGEEERGEENALLCNG